VITAAGNNTEVLYNNGGKINITGGVITATGNKATAVYNRSGTAIISGGVVMATGDKTTAVSTEGPTTINNNAVVFAYGKAVTDVISGSYTQSGDAVIAAWDNTATSPPIYTAGTNDDIFKLPPTATAVWGREDVNGGILLNHGGNTRFIPIADVTVNPPAAATTYTVTVNKGTGAGSYYENDIVTITADSAPTGKQFKSWIISPNVTFTDGNANTPKVKFTMPAAAVTAEATYEDVATGIVGMGSAHPLRIYPNPTTGKITISDYPISDNPIIEIYDILGRKQSDIECRKSDNRTSDIEIDISHLSSGLYFLRVGKKVIKVVKE
jgi:hypothetical protein